MPESTATPRSPQEVEDLKRSWHRDPCWPLEETEGFEAHREELLAYRLQVDEDGRQRVHRQLVEFATAIGIPENLTLAAHIQQLERRLDALERPTEA